MSNGCGSIHNELWLRLWQCRDYRIGQAWKAQRNVGAGISSSAVTVMIASKNCRIALTAPMWDMLVNQGAIALAHPCDVYYFATTSEPSCLKRALESPSSGSPPPFPPSSLLYFPSEVASHPT